MTISGSASGSAMRRTESVKTPVAFTTMRAAIVNSSPVSASRAVSAVHIAFRVAQQVRSRGNSSQACAP